MALTPFDNWEVDLKRFRASRSSLSTRCPVKKLSINPHFVACFDTQDRGIVSWGVPNAGKRGFKAQAQVKKEGITAGVFDEHYAWNHGIAFLEWKDSRGNLSDAQIDWGNAMVDRGFGWPVYVHLSLRWRCSWSGARRLNQSTTKETEMSNVANVAADEVRLLIERAERLESEKAGIAEDIRDVSRKHRVGASM